MSGFLSDLLGIHELYQLGVSSTPVERKRLDVQGATVEDSPTTGATILRVLLNQARYLRPELSYAGGTLFVDSAKAYAVYCGYINQPKVIKYVEAVLTTNGTGSQTAEVAIASSPLAPNKNGQTLTVLASSGTVDSLTAGATKVVRNTTAFNSGNGVSVQDKHIWAVIRCALATTQPTFAAVSGDMAGARALILSSAGALTGLSTIAGVSTNTPIAACAPMLSIALD